MFQQERKAKRAFEMVAKYEGELKQAESKGEVDKKRGGGVGQGAKAGRCVKT